MSPPFSARPLVILLLLLAVAGGGGCGGDRPPETSPPAPAPPASAAAEDTTSDAPAAGPQSAFDQTGSRLAAINQPFTGDFDAMLERRVIRALVTYNHTQYFLDGPEQRGITYDALQLFQKHLNEKHKTGDRPIQIVIMPVARNELLPKLAAGFADIAAGALTVTAERRKTVDFTVAGMSGVRQIVVTGPAGPQTLASVEDLAGQEVWARPSSAYHESLLRLNQKLTGAGKAPVVIRPADETLEDEDLLEMVNAGLLGTVVVDDYLAEFWSEVFPAIKVHSEVALHEGGDIAWALRKGTPRLMAEANEFMAKNRQGTLTGNVLLKRYLGTTKFARNAFEPADLERFRQLVGFFQKYADQYRFDWLLCAAQGYQESRLDQSVRSPVGAVGVMQVMPATAKDPVVGIPDIEQLEPNIHAGIKYLRYTVDTYFADPAIDPVNQLLFAFASYNAGPNRIARLREEARAAGLDPNKWFRNVELVVARRVGREPVQYVGNIFKYYIAYKIIAEQRQREGASRAPEASRAPG
jgi:membrane-bound lytic murein transglycosylase MltF